MLAVNQSCKDLKQCIRSKHTIRYKGSKFTLSKLQGGLFIVLSNGKKHSSHQLMQQLTTSDPRKEVQYLRRKGINVQDIWVSATDTTPRHKLYFIDPKECGVDYER